ncbi:hypothetical protein BH11PAT4_BH11PAT4_0470 [soil metagenome]
MQQKVLVPIIGFALLFASVPQLVRAELSSSSATSAAKRVAERQTELAQKAKEAKEKASEIKEKRSDRIASGCEKIEGKITGILSKHATAVAKHEANQDALLRRGTELSVKLKAAEFDTTKLDADLLTFKEKLATAKASFAAYNASLTATQQYTCGQSEGAFKTQLQDSRDAYKAFRDDLKDAREFWKAVVMVDIKALRELATTTAAN